MAKVKLADVAREAGVSTATVSFVLNGKGNISREMREKVMLTVEKMGYNKNLYASRMATGGHSHVGILMYQDDSKAYEWNFVRQMLIALEAVLTAGGYFPVILPISLEETPKQLYTRIVASSCGALCSIHFANRELFTLLESSGLPVVVINNSGLQDSFSTVCADDFQGAYEGTKHLLDLGHRRIAYLEYRRPDLTNMATDSFYGFRKAMEERNAEFPAQFKLTVDLHSLSQSEETARALRDFSPRPTALFAIDDYVLARLMPSLAALGVKVPGDLSVVAPGDALDFNEPFNPRISTMRFDTATAGKLAGELLINRLERRGEREQVIKLRETFVDRGSCISFA